MTYIVVGVMTNDDIIDLYDSNPDMTLAELSTLTCMTIADLKQILMGC